MSFYNRYPSSGVTTVNGLSGALTLAAGSGITLTPVGNTITIASSGGGGGANTTLSNLGVTSINADLIFAASQSVTTQAVTGSTAGKSLTLQPGSYDSGTPPQLNLVGATGTGGNGGEVAVLTSGNGAITLTTSTGGIRLSTSGPNSIAFADTTQGTSGYVWTSVDSDGTGAWMPSSGAVGDAPIVFSDYSGSPSGGTQVVIEGPSKPDGDDTDGTSITITSGNVASGAAVGSLILQTGHQADSETPEFGQGSILINASGMRPVQDGGTILGSAGFPFGGAYISGSIRDGTSSRSIEVLSRQLKKVGNIAVLSWGGAHINIPSATVPATSSDTGTAGDMAFDDNYIYRCIATDTWVRTPLTTW